MELTILEDRPYNLLEAIEKMETMGIHTQNMIFFHSKETFHSDIAISKIENEFERRKVNFIKVDIDSFENKMDSLYQDKGMVFFFDMDLRGDYSLHFLERINVEYALQKKRQENGDGRIWFYTTGPRSTIEQIKMNFPNRYIPITKFDTKTNQVILDYNFIEKNILK